MIEARLTSVSLLIFALLATACVTAPPPATATSGPSHWVAEIDFSETDCDDIEAAFQNLGAQRKTDGRVTDDGGLAEHVFSRHLPRGRAIRAVDIESNIQAGWLTATLVGAVSLEISFAVSCHNGWHLVTESRSGQYLGDGVQLERFQQSSYFRLDREGRLVARVLTDARYKKDFAETTSESSETWYRFEPASADDP